MRTHHPNRPSTFQARHLTVTDAGHGVAVRVASKRTAIWAGGLSTVGGKLPE
jgi:hypothetical protein